MTEKQRLMQLGKQGINGNFMGVLENHFNKTKNVKISVLKSARENKADVQKFADEILEKLNSQPRTANDENSLLPTTKSLGKKYTARVLGFTIFVKKWRRDVR